MGYKDHAQREMKIAEKYGTYDGIDFSQVSLDIVNTVLDVISEEGHSGGSMGVFSGMFRQWAKDPKELKDSELLNPIWEIVKDIPQPTLSHTLKTIFKVMRFKPLTPLTGEEDEWVHHDYMGLDHKLAQNKRLGSVFKEDGKCYNIDGYVFHEPAPDYSTFFAFTTQPRSRVDVTFPYYPPENPIYVYYKRYDSRDLTDTLSEHENPKEWLKQRREQYLLGFDPQTGLIRPAAFFLNTDEEDKELIDAHSKYNAIKEEFYKEHPDDKEKQWEFNRILSEHVRDSILNYSFFSSKFRDNNGVLIGDGLLKNPFKVSNVDIVHHLLRLEKELEITTESNPELKKAFLMHPDKHYQEWVKTNKIHYTYLPVYVDPETGLNLLYIDNERKLTIEDPIQYLYAVCKVKGLKFKRPKQAYKR